MILALAFEFSEKTEISGISAGLSLIHNTKLSGDKMAQGMATRQAQWDGLGSAANCADDSASSTTLCANRSLPRTRQQLIQRIHNYLPVLSQGTHALSQLIERH